MRFMVVSRQSVDRITHDELYGAFGAMRAQAFRFIPFIVDSNATKMNEFSCCHAANA